MAEDHDSWLSALGVDVDKFRQANKAQSAATESMVDGAVGSVIDDAASAAQKLVNDAPVSQGLKDVATTGINFEKGVYEGAYQGAKGLVGAVQTAGDVVSGAALLKGAGEVAAAAVSDDARKDLVKDVTDDINKANAMGNMIVNPIGSAISVGAQIKSGYDAAAAKGQTAEFIGKGVGIAAVVAATSALGGGEAEIADLTTAGEEGGSLAEGGIIEKPTYVPPGESVPPVGPGTRPTVFPPAEQPGWAPTDPPPGPAPEFGRDVPNPYQPWEEGGPNNPNIPRIPRPPRMPDFGEDTPAPPDTDPNPSPPSFEPSPSSARPDPSPASVPPPSEQAPDTIPESRPPNFDAINVAPAADAFASSDATSASSEVASAEEIGTDPTA
jgi:hypothetical protein